MPQYKNLPRVRVVKKADEFVSAVDHIFAWLTPYWKVALVLAGIFLLLGVGYLVFQQNRREAARDMSKMSYEIGLKPQEEREGAYRDMMRHYSSKSQSAFVALSLVQLLLQEGKKEEAVKLLAEADLRLPYSFHSLLGASQAQLAWEQGKLEESLKRLEMLEKLPDNEQNEQNIAGAFPSFVKGEILEALGKKDEAAQVYEELAKAEEDPFVQKMAQGRLVFLRLGAD